MDFSGAVLLKIKSLHLNSDSQVVKKIVNEVLDLFDFEFDEDLTIENFFRDEIVETHMKLGDREFLVRIDLCRFATSIIS